MTVEDLEAYGMSRMEDNQIQQLLTTQQTGVLALPTEGAPSMRPLSFWFDGDRTLYFTYVVGSGSQKVALSDRAAEAQFLVYRTETPFNWRSALFTGTIEEVPEDEQAAIRDEIDIAWRPEVFERAGESEATALYRFRIDDRDGIKQVELPPEFRAPADE